MFSLFQSMMVCCCHYEYMTNATIRYDCHSSLPTLYEIWEYFLASQWIFRYFCCNWRTGWYVGIEYTATYNVVNRMRCVYVCPYITLIIDDHDVLDFSVYSLHSETPRPATSQQLPHDEKQKYLISAYSQINTFQNYDGWTFFITDTMLNLRDKCTNMNQRDKSMVEYKWLLWLTSIIQIQRGSSWKGKGRWNGWSSQILWRYYLHFNI